MTVINLGLRARIEAEARARTEAAAELLVQAGRMTRDEARRAVETVMARPSVRADITAKASR